MIPRGNDLMNVEAVFGGTDLHRYARQQEWAKLLAACDGHRLRILNEYNRTPLHYCIEGGAPDDVILELVKVAPFQVRVRDASGETPLHLGCFMGMGLVVTYALLEADARSARGSKSVLTIRNKEGKTPLCIMRNSHRASSLVRAFVAEHFKFQALQNTVKNKRPWKFHREEYDAVLDVLEESARGGTGVVGLAY